MASITPLQRTRTSTPMPAGTFTYRSASPTSPTRASRVSVSSLPSTKAYSASATLPTMTQFASTYASQPTVSNGFQAAYRFAQPVSSTVVEEPVPSATQSVSLPITTTVAQPVSSLTASAIVQPAKSLTIPQPVTAKVVEGVSSTLAQAMPLTQARMVGSTRVAAANYPGSTYIMSGASMPMPIQQAVAVETVQQVPAVEFEIRPLSEDRIIYAAPVRKGEMVVVPDVIVDAPVAELAVMPDAPAPEAAGEYDVVQALEQIIPAGPRVCILGGTKFNDEASQALVEALAAEFSAQLYNRVVVLTGGMPGVQETFAKGCANGPPVINMLPSGQSSNFGVGVDFTEFADLPERIAVFGQIGDIYISVEGGPGVAKEANAAFSRGAIVLPLISTGGASGGMFDFPAAALEQPNFVNNEQWELLHTKGVPDATAKALVDVISSLLPA